MSTAHGPSSTGGSAQDPIEMPVDVSATVGSARLRDALRARDVEAIGRALRHDIVILPLLEDPATGETQIQVIGIEGEGPDPVGLELCLFSSGAAYARFLGDSPQRTFAVARGANVRDALLTHAAALTRVVFDPAEDHAMAASPEDVIAVLEPQPEDDDVAWLLGDSSPAIPPADADRTGGAPRRRLFGRRGRRDGTPPRR